MSGLDVVRELEAGLGDRDGVWLFLQRFTSEWLDPIVVDDGYAEADLAAAEKRLGIRLPAAMRDAYLLFGRRTDLTSNRDKLLGPEDLTVDDSGQTLVFRAQDQWCAQWGVPLAALDRDDPPVVWEDLVEPDGGRWQLYLDRFSVACVEMVLSESLFSADQVGHDDRKLDAEALGRLEEHYERLAIPDYPRWQAPDGPPVRWYGGPDVVLRDDGREWLWARARDDDALAAARRTLPGVWSMTPG